MTETVLITGAAGFFGRHLAAMVARADAGSVVGVGRSEAVGSWTRFAVADMRDAAAVHRVVAAVHPTRVFHLAGLLRGSASELMAHNATPVPHLCEALAKTNPQARLVVVGSAAEYGAGRTDGAPTPENWPCQPVTPYGVSKLVATQLALAHGERLGLSVCVARPANLLGPGLRPELVVGSLVAQLAACQRAGQPAVVTVGDVHAQRDFLDVDDACRGLLMLARDTGSHRIVHLASGRCHSIRAVIELLQVVLGTTIEVRGEATLAVGASPAIVRLSTELAATALGFHASIPLRASLQRMWDAAMAVTATQAPR